MKVNFTLTGKTLAGVVLAGLAVVLAVSSLISQNLRAADTASAADSVARSASEVTAGELAQWIIEKRQDYQLIDLRDPWQFDDYHIPTAINLPLTQVFAPENLKRLDKSKKIVVYGLGAGRAAQTQLLLSMKGYHAYALNDGVIAWWDEVMTPTSMRSANPSSTGYQQARQLREFFMAGGRAGEAPPSMATPPPQATIAAPEKSAAPPAAKPAVKPATKPEKVPPKDKEKERLKLGRGCS